MDLFEAPAKPKLENVSVTQFAEIAKVHRETIYAWIREARIHPIQVGGKMFFSNEEVQRICEERKVKQEQGRMNRLQKQARQLSTRLRHP